MTGRVVIRAAQRRACIKAGNTTRVVALTRGETALLVALIDADGDPVSRRALAALIPGRGRRGVGSRAVDTHICVLRRKLGDDALRQRLIVTVPGSGYAVAIADGWDGLACLMSDDVNTRDATIRRAKRA